MKELVVDGANGMVFHNSIGLLRCITQLLDSPSELTELKKGVTNGDVFKSRWDDNWNAVAAPFFIKPVHLHRFPTLLFAFPMSVVLFGFFYLNLL